jgi:accessory gene regulator protein AgrB
MYVWLWRHLPGALALKLVQATVLVLAVVALLMFVIFPWIEPHLPINNVTVPAK